MTHSPSRTRVRDWAESYRVGPVVIKIRAAGCVVGWAISGDLGRLSPAERVRLVVIFRERVAPRADLDAMLDELAAVLRGGLGRTLHRSGVVYVDRL